MLQGCRAVLGAAWVVVFCLVLAACATPQKIGDPGAGPAFERTGRFAITVNHSDGSRDAVQGGFAWRDTPGELRVDLANPLGNTLAQVLVRPGASVLRRSDGSVEQAGDPDRLLEQVLGSEVPVAGLRDWLQGRLAGTPAQDVRKDDAGRIAGFSQYGWQVSLSRYDREGPRVLHLERRYHGDQITVRLVIDSD